MGETLFGVPALAAVGDLTAGTTAAAVTGTTMTAFPAFIASAAPYVGGALSVLSAGMSIIGGSQQSSIAKMEAQQAEEQRQIALASGAQQEAARRRDLAATLATQQAIRSGRGTELFGEMDQTFAATSTQAAEDDIMTIRANARARANAYAYQEGSAQIRESNAMLAGYGKAAGSLLAGANAMTRSTGAAGVGAD